MVKTFSVVAHPKSSQNKVVEKDGVLHVYVHAAPDKGKANSELLKTLAEYFHVAISNVQLQKGLTSKQKVVTVDY